MIEIHFHAVDHGLQMFALNIEGMQMGRKCARHWVGRRAVLHLRDFFAPPDQLGACQCLIGTFIDDVVDFTTKGIQSSDGLASLRWQKQKAVIKTGAAFCGFLLAVIFG